MKRRLEMLSCIMILASSSVLPHPLEKVLWGTCQQESGDSQSGSDEAPKQKLGGLWPGRGKKKKKSKEKVEKEGGSDKCAWSPTADMHMHTNPGEPFLQ